MSTPLTVEDLLKVLENARTITGYCGSCEKVVDYDNFVEGLKKLSSADLARVAHEVNKAYCEAMGDNSQPSWESAPQWQKDSALLGVDLHLSGDHGPEASHESWMAQKLQNGWKYGPVKNPEAKEHPCLVPFSELPKEQQVKDFLFRAVVNALKETTK